MTYFELSTLELELGNFDLVLESIKAKVNDGDHESIRLLAEIYHYGIGTQKDDSECQRLLDLLEQTTSH